MMGWSPFQIRRRRGATIMTDQPVLIVGAGLAGLAAAVALAQAGISVRVVDQAPRPGGAVHRQPLPGVRSGATGAQARRWQTLMAEMARWRGRIDLTCETGFGGLDYQGAALLTGRGAALLHPRAVIFATGARERVQPRSGWTLPGVTTAGAVQAALKTTAEPPAGRILLAGSGPLLLAVGAELARLGAPPVAIIEAGRPFSRPFAAMGLPVSYMAEAAGYLARLKQARVPLLTGHHLTRISAEGKALVAHIETPNGAMSLSVDRIGLHDGIAPNDLGQPDCPAIPVLRIGDCREALGARAALADGRAGGARLAALLMGTPVDGAAPEVDRQRAAQALLARIFAHDGETRLTDLPQDTVLCRCENRTLADLYALGPAPTVRQLRLDGRFGMGPCQGRFCAEWVGKLARPDLNRPDLARLGADRWPNRPILIADFVDAPMGTLKESFPQ